MQAVGKTHKGLVRTINQDTVFVSTTPVGPLPNLFLVADGMGGHNAGDFASRFLVEILVEFLEQYNDETSEKTALKKGIEYANQLLYHKSNEDYRLSGMGTTLVAAVIKEGQLSVLNIGDSRLYLVDEGISQVTEDHSYVEEMVRLGRMERNSSDYLKNKNIITRAIGTTRWVEAEPFYRSLQDGQKILLCSDGLTNMLEDEKILQVINQAESLAEAAENLVAQANEHGGPDNISVILIDPGMKGVEPC